MILGSKGQALGFLFVAATADKGYSLKHAKLMNSDPHNMMY